MFKRLILAIFATLSMLLVTAAPALAIPPISNKVCGGHSATICETNSETGTGKILGQSGILTKIAQVMVYIAGAVAVLVLAYSGIKYATSQGDPGNIKSAKDAAMYAIVGVVIAIFGQAIVSFVLSKL